LAIISNVPPQVFEMLLEWNKKMILTNEPDFSEK
jgi:hypothetical protein